MTRRPGDTRGIGRRGQFSVLQPIGRQHVVFRPVIDKRTDARRAPVDRAAHHVAAVDRDLLHTCESVAVLWPRLLPSRR